MLLHVIIYIYSMLNMSSYWYLQLSYYENNSNLLPLLICNQLQQEKKEKLIATMHHLLNHWISAYIIAGSEFLISTFMGNNFIN